MGDPLEERFIYELKDGQRNLEQRVNTLESALYAILGFTDVQIAARPEWIRELAIKGLRDNS